MSRPVASQNQAHRIHVYIYGWTRTTGRPTRRTTTATTGQTRRDGRTEDGRRRRDGRQRTDDLSLSLSLCLSIHFRPCVPQRFFVGAGLPWRTTERQLISGTSVRQQTRYLTSTRASQERDHAVCSNDAKAGRLPRHGFKGLGLIGVPETTLAFCQGAGEGHARGK